MLFGCILLHVYCMLLHCFEYRVPKLNKQVKETVGGWITFQKGLQYITIHNNCNGKISFQYTATTCKNCF